MFAQAGIIGRVTRERQERRKQLNLLSGKKKSADSTASSETTAEARVSEARIKQRCFIPCLRVQTGVAVFALLLFLLGSVLCNFAFHAKYYAQDGYAPLSANATNSTKPEPVINIGRYTGLRVFAYLGPVVIGLGVFLVIIVCVTVFDRREKILKDLNKRKAKEKERAKSEYSIRAAIATCHRRAEEPGAEQPLVGHLEKRDSQPVAYFSHLSDMMRMVYPSTSSLPIGNLRTRLDRRLSLDEEMFGSEVSLGTSYHTPPETSSLSEPCNTDETSSLYVSAPSCIYEQAADDMACADNAGYETSSYSLKAEALQKCIEQYMAEGMERRASSAHDPPSSSSSQKGIHTFPP